MRIGEKIKKTRNVIDQETFAKMIGRTKKSLIRWEKGETSPTFMDIFKICEVTHTKISDFFADVDG